MKWQPTEDIRPLSEFRANAAAFISQVRETGRALILTQHGRSAAVLLDVGAYEALVERAELLGDLKVADSQIRKGRGLSNARAKAAALRRLRR